MNRFYLQRNEDETGISGTGRVAEGVAFSDGTACLRWLTEYTSFGFYRSMEELEAIHGHGGKTIVVWVGDHEHRRGEVDAYQDRCENVPFASVGDAVSLDPPDYIPEEDAPAYLGGYVAQCRRMFGPTWNRLSDAEALEVLREAGFSDDDVKSALARTMKALEGIE